MNDSPPTPSAIPQIVQQLTTNSLDPFLTKDEDAALLKKSRRTIELWTRAGYLSSIKIGHSVFFEREQMLRDIRRFGTGRP